MKRIERLREETQVLHKRIEAKNLSRYIMDHSIDIETYKLLLLQNYFAYFQTETEIERMIPGYSANKHRQLQKDLEELDVPIELPFENDVFECHSTAEALGAAYVVEGSALGGMVLAKNLEKCPALAGVVQPHFFNGNKENLQGWKNFKKKLEEYSCSKVEETAMVEKAKATFRFFEQVFTRKYQVV